MAAAATRVLTSTLRAGFLFSTLGACSSKMGRLGVAQFPCRSDNYGFLLRDEAAGLTAAIDTPDASAIIAECESRGWRLTHIFNTHHHSDHAGGNKELKDKHAVTIIAAEADRHRIPGVDMGVAGGDIFRFGETAVRVIDVAGHTKGHIAFYLEDEGMAFVGDALFALGCGRLFEGTPAQAKASLERLGALPPATRVYCAHEYTQTNARYALTVDPENSALRRRAAEIDAARAAGVPTVPTSVELELRTNPFLRSGSPAIRAALRMDAEATDLEVFTELRKRRDKW